MTNQNAYNLYQQTHTSVESPAKLIEMLYEGILRFSSLARRGIELNDIEKKIYYINRTTDIFTELLNVLDYDNGGEVAHYLTGLYMQQIKFLTQANIENNVEKIDIVIKVTKGLLEAWREIHQNI
ncbi:flagellar export chaperone FliS [Helicobacter sp. MIT 14-3879]|uniref:flagellar export chaperone FliS n=1 Tax=Helicobacter sp. MIT 14-3879 TaxID=2040649 RepID=UPI000E1E71E3|nr:flagellar export chaperone FliS [Helicobacter sp. MIT 14-3879]RDU64730.1 flagella export chaperone FliS [Helicobacter sp. MIT 14-3879]